MWAGSLTHRGTGNFRNDATGVHGVLVPLHASRELYCFVAQTEAFRQATTPSITLLSPSWNFCGSTTFLPATLSVTATAEFTKDNAAAFW